MKCPSLLLDVITACLNVVRAQILAQTNSTRFHTFIDKRIDLGLGDCVVFVAANNYPLLYGTSRFVTQKNPSLTSLFTEYSTADIPASIVRDKHASLTWDRRQTLFELK